MTDLALRAFRGRATPVAAAAVLLPITVLLTWESRNTTRFPLSLVGATLLLHAFIARSMGAPTAVYASLVLATIPAWFVRGMTEASSVGLPLVAFASVALAVLDEGLARSLRILLLTIVAACIWWARAQVALVFTCGVPCLAVGASYLAVDPIAASGRRGRLAWLSCAVGLGIIGWTLVTAKLAPGGAFGMASRMAYACVPWTPLLPFVLIRRPRFEPRTPLAMRAYLALALGAILTLSLEGALPSPAGAGSYACGEVAACVAVLLGDLDRRPGPFAMLAVGACVIGAIVAHDLSLGPERVLAALAQRPPNVDGARAARVARIGAGAITVAMGFALLAETRWLTHRRFHIPRSALILGAGVVAGLVLRLHAYPPLLRQIAAVSTTNHPVHR